ncbi:MAG: hypothetical protein ACYCY1_12535 [Sulfuriferula sp.]
MDQNDTQQTAEVIEPPVAPAAIQPVPDPATPPADPAVVADDHPAHSVINEIEDKLELWCDDIDGEFGALLTKLRELL